jgi:hypothetical protein
MNSVLHVKAHIHTYSNSRFSVIVFLIVVIVGFNFLVIFALLLHVLFLGEVTLSFLVLYILHFDFTIIENNLGIQGAIR